MIFMYLYGVLELDKMIKTTKTCLTTYDYISYIKLSVVYADIGCVYRNLSLFNIYALVKY